MKTLDLTTVNTLEKGLTGIYKITIHNKSYVGSSVSIKHRLKHHLWSLNSLTHHNRTMQNLYNKYGKASIGYEILELCNEDELLERELFYIQSLNPYMNHILDPVTQRKDQVYKRRLSESGKNSFKQGRQIHNKKATHMYALDGTYLMSFDDATSAAKFLGYNSPTMICNVCRGAQYTAYDKRWSYDKVDKLNAYKKNYKETAVVQLTMQNEVVKEWDSITEAQIVLKISNIIRAIKYNRTAGGYKWKLKT